MHTKFEALPEHTETLRRIAASGAELKIFLHIAKTGGTTLGLAFHNSPLAIRLGIYDLSVSKAELEGRNDDMAKWELKRINRMMWLADRDNTGQEVYLQAIDHKTISYADELCVALNSAHPVPIVTTVRPARQRLISAFRDYWTQVHKAHAMLAGEEISTNFLGSDSPDLFDVPALMNYLDDSKHYVDADGQIDGVAWFSSFAEHGSGIPFFMDDIFEHDVHGFAERVKSGKLRLIPSHRLDRYIKKNLQVAPQRHRASAAPSSNIVAALKASASILTEVALRDADYDRIIARNVLSPHFLPRKK